ncbi:unnamed protein product, partial [Ascophyllum nodosum]
ANANGRGLAGGHRSKGGHLGAGRPREPFLGERGVGAAGVAPRAATLFAPLQLQLEWRWWRQPHWHLRNVRVVGEVAETDLGRGRRS